MATDEPVQDDLTPEQIRGMSDDVRRVLQRIRAGWLPHKVGTWWWGRPIEQTPSGFTLWSQGLVPSMSVIEPMDDDEIEVWTAYLHPMAEEAMR